MKHLALLFISLICCITAAAQSPATEYFSVGSPIAFCGTDFYLAWSSHPNDNIYMQEYLPQGEPLERFNQMVSVQILFVGLSPQDAMQAKIAELDRRKKNDPLINYYSVENENGERMLEFIVSDGSNGKLSAVEVNVYHFKTMKLKGKNALVLTFYSGRAYDDDILPFIKSIPEHRASWLSAMASLSLTPIFPEK